MNPIASTTTGSSPSAALARPAAPAVPEVRPLKAVADTPSSTSNANQVKTGVAASASKASQDDIQRATEDLEQRVKTLAPELQFSVDKTSGRAIIKFTDRTTNEVIRQFPSEEALALTRAMDQFQRGLIFNRKV
jgi:flagellar protein FlaG